jgi:hypothetical protein
MPQEAIPVEPCTVIRARLARAQRFAEPPEVIAELRRSYHAAKIRDVLLSWMASDPAPTSAQRAELAALLLDGGADATA